MENVARLVVSFSGPEPDEELQEWIRAGVIAGVVLFSDNFISPTQMRETTARLKAWGGATFQIMIDEEGGRVRRLPSAISPMPALSAYGTKGGPARPAAAYAKVSRTLLELGITTLLAPVLDVRSTGNGWLADRTYSDDPGAVADFAAHAVRAIQETGLAACAKHFPGLGGVGADLHHRQFVVADPGHVIEQRDLPPFRAAIAAGLRTIMVAHAIYRMLDSARPAVFSPLIIDHLLRKRLVFSGLILTDDLAMGAVVSTTPIEKAVELTLAAGCDLALVCRNRPLQRRAVQFLLRETQR